MAGIAHPPSFCIAGVAQSHIHLRFAWQAWHLWHWVARLGCVTPMWHPPWFRGPCRTHLCHTPSVTYHLCQTPSVSMCCHTPSFIQSLSTILSHTTLSHTHTSSHTIFHTQLCRTPSFTYYLSHVALAQARANGAENPCLPSCVSGLFWHVCFSGLFSSSKSDWSRKLFGHQIQNSCFVYRHVYVAASSACFGMFAFPACLAQAKATGAENGLDIKFIIRLPACLPSYGLDIKFVVAVGQARLSRRISRCTTWSTEDHGTPHSAHSRSAVMPHAEQMTLQR